MGARQRAANSTRAGTILALLGALGIVALAFVLGVWTGRHWPLLARAAVPAAAPAADRDERRPAPPAPPVPSLTFYRELRAPVAAMTPAWSAKPARTAPPAEAPAARPEPPAPRPATAAVREAAVEMPPRPDPARAVEREGPGEGGARFAVQAGAYRTRPAAEALRAELSAAGLAARVVDADAAGGVRYRVRVGPYPTREAARAVAARLSGERSLPAFVTTR